MNAIVKAETEEDRLITVLGNSLYPGAKPESIRMVLAWCQATGRDPMRKPIHIVGMSVKVGRENGKDKYEWRDVLMPGIGTYRIDAARTGQYAGKTEPEFGPDVTERFDNMEVTYPQWCRVTVKRIVGGNVCDFTAKERWIENYATAGKDTIAPNYMWKKRPHGQLAKCAESQALRMAFPEETGNTNTAEEMDGKSFDGLTIDAKAEPVPPKVEPPAAPKERKQSVAEWLNALELDLAAATTESDWVVIDARQDVRAAKERLANGAKERLMELLACALDRITNVETHGAMET